MKIKKFTYHVKGILLLAPLFFSLQSCEKLLDEKIYNSQNIESFYSTASQAEIALNGVYSSLWDYMYKDGYHVILGDIPGEVAQANNNPNEFDLFAWTSSSSELNNYWVAAYTGINRANTLIDNLVKSSVEAKDQNRIIGQAKFLRALYYFNLVKVFGGVPLHSTATMSSNDAAKERASQQDVYDFIVKDLIESTELLGSFSSADHTAGRVTSAAARSLLAKVYLQQRKWGEAALTAKAVIDLGVYQLLSDYNQVNDPAFKNSKEHIFSIQNGGKDNLPTSSDGNFNYFTIPAISFEGKQVEFSASGGGARIQIEESFYANEPKTNRQYYSYRDFMPYYFALGSFDKINARVPLDRVRLVKFFHPNLATKELRSSVNTPILRYSDMLLTYAEALNEQLGPNSEAIAALNQVRRRARGEGTVNEQSESIYPDLSLALSKEQFRQAILIERAREFIAEGERRNELNRHDLLASTIKEHRNITIKPGYVLYPIPEVQRSLNSLLSQNPDY